MPLFGLSLPSFQGERWNMLELSESDSRGMGSYWPWEITTAAVFEPTTSLRTQHFSLVPFPSAQA